MTKPSPDFWVHLSPDTQLILNGLLLRHPAFTLSHHRMIVNVRRKTAARTKSVTDSLTISLTRMVIEKFAPEELPMLDQKGFPEIGEGKVGSGPMGIGLDVALLFLAPFVYAFFEALVKEAGKSATSEIVSLLKSSSDGSETREKIAEYLIAKGFEPEVSNSVAKDILKIAKEH